MARKKHKTTSSARHFTPQMLAELTRNAAGYRQDPANRQALAQMQAYRLQLARLWMESDPGRLEILYAGPPGKAQKILLDNTLSNAPLSAEESALGEESRGKLGGEDDAVSIPHLLTAMLFHPGDRLPERILDARIPEWLTDDFYSYLLRPRHFFERKGEVETYRLYMERVISHIHGMVKKQGTPPPVNSPGHRLAELFTRHAYLIPLYFSRSDLKEIMSQRAQLAEIALRARGCSLDHRFSTSPGNRDRIRLGILNAHYRPQTETYATLPVFEHLDRDRYEIILFTTEPHEHPVTRYCHSRASRVVVLTGATDEQARLVREQDLDILFVGSNMTAVHSAVTRLAAWRLAPVQTTSICSPVTTGIAHIDYYIAGDLTVTAEQGQQHYTERLATIPGSGLCFRYPGEAETPQLNPTRQWMGIPEEAVVYASGANFFKITPELRETWVRILADVPDSLLVLYPFNPYWTRAYPAAAFFDQMQRLLSRYGVAKERLIVLQPLPERADIKAVLALSDVYLDAYPYGGATSLIDPLQVNLPPVVMEGAYLRFRQASALLRELAIPGLITQDEKSYSELAIRLGAEASERKRMREAIAKQMRSQPAFLDSETFSSKMDEVFVRLLGKSR